MDRWLDVSAAPRDGTPVILWLDDDEAPPAFAVTVGAWEVNPVAGVSYWRVFGAKGMPSLYHAILVFRPACQRLDAFAGSSCSRCLTAACPSSTDKASQTPT
jgi:hypothetical protein